MSAETIPAETIIDGIYVERLLSSCEDLAAPIRTSTRSFQYASTLDNAARVIRWLLADRTNRPASDSVPAEGDAVAGRCRTPGTIYGTEFRAKRIKLEIEFPLRLFGDISPAERDRLSAEFHDALLPVVERIFQNHWGKIGGLTIDGSVMPFRWEDL